MNDRLPPHSPEAEQGVLGSIMLDARYAMPFVESKLQHSDAFYDLRHQTIYESLQLLSCTSAVDVVLLIQNLKDRQLLEQVGGAAYVANLPETVPSAYNVEYYLEIVLEKLMLRRMIQTCTNAVCRAYEHKGNAIDLIEQFERDALAVRISKQSAIRPMKAIMGDAIADIEAAHKNGGKIMGLSTGLTDLDVLTDGLHQGEYIVIAAYPSCGKTAMAMNIVEHLALTGAVPCGVFSEEMTDRALGMRLLCSCARVNLHSIRQGFLAERDFPKLTFAASKLSKSTIYIDDSSGQSIGQVRAKARRMVQEHGIKLFVVDYLQLLSNPSIRSQDNREQEVSSISKGLKAMGKELRVPVIVLSQLNEEGKTRESRAIEQDADSIWLLEKDEDEEGPEDPSVVAVNLNIRKQRNGPAPATVHLRFLKSYTRFESASKVSDEDVPMDR